jgi:hypothetical protein
MIFLRFGKELVNLSQVYQIDLKSGEAGVGVQIAFFYHLAGTTSGGYKLNRSLSSLTTELSVAEEIQSIPEILFSGVPKVRGTCLPLSIFVRPACHIWISSR